MTQTRIGSLIEAAAQTVIGYVINLGVQLVLYPIMGATFTFGQNIVIGCVFMVVSLVRGFVLRRWFNARLHAALTGERK
jgi:hypothetical protein